MVALVHGFVYVHHIFESYVVVLPHLLILEEIFSYFSIQFLDALVQFLLLVGHFLHLLAHLRDLPLDLGVLVASDPSDKDELFEPAADKIYRHPTFYDIPDEVGHM